MAKLFAYLKPIWWEIAISFFILAAQSYFALMIPSLMQGITRIIENPTSYTSSMSGLVTIFGFNLIKPTGNSATDTWIVGGIMCAFGVLFLLAALCSSLIVSHIGAFFGRTIRHEVFRKTLSLSMSQFGDFSTASLITRTTNDVEQVQMVLQQGIRILIMSPLSMIIAIIMILRSDPWLALIVAAALPLVVIIAFFLFHAANPLFQKIQTTIDHLTGILRSSLTGVRVIRAFNQEKRENKKYSEVNKEYTKFAIKVDSIMSIGEPIIGIIFDIVYIAVYFYGVARMNGKTASGGTISSAMVEFSGIMTSAEYAMNLMNSFMMVGMLLFIVPRGIACAKRINEVLSEKVLIADPANPQLPEKRTGVVEFKDVTFTFPDAKVPTLNHISFKTKPGCTTAIIGSTGSGKSSIINLIPRFYDVTEGQVLVDGLDVRSFRQIDLRAGIGFVTQTSALFSGTIRSNLMFGKKDATEEEMNEALRVAQATHFIEKKGQGLDCKVEEGGKNFSGGQRQRLSIARALVKKAGIYVFDDSFSALDFKTDIRLRTALKEYTKNSSVIVVAQRVSSILNADDIIVLNEGKIVGEGTHRSLMETCSVYQEIVSSQMDNDEIKKTLLMQRAAAGGAER